MSLSSHANDIFDKVLLWYLKKEFNKGTICIPEDATVDFKRDMSGEFDIIFPSGGSMSHRDLSFWSFCVFAAEYHGEDYRRRMECGLKDDAKQLYAATRTKAFQVDAFLGHQPDKEDAILSLKFDTDGSNGESRTGLGMMLYTASLSQDFAECFLSECRQYLSENEMQTARSIVLG